MNKDFDLNLKVKSTSSNGPTPRITSVAWCTPGCLTGTTCGTSECGLTRNCLNTWACG